MNKAGMNFRSWVSNSRRLRQHAADENDLDNDDVSKVLGMRWNQTSDTLMFADRDIPFLDVVTKRDILKFSSRIYDPLGLLSPITVQQSY